MLAIMAGALVMTFAFASQAFAAVEVDDFYGYASIGSICWAECGTPKEKFESNWLQADPKGELRIEVGIDDTVTHSPVHAAKVEVDLNNDRIYDVSMDNSRSGTWFNEVFKSVVVPSAATESVTMKARITADDLSQVEKEFTVRPLGMRRVLLTWDNASKVDLHAWRTAPLERDGVAHIWFQREWLDFRPNEDVWDDEGGVYVTSRRSVQGTKPVAMVERPIKFRDVMTGNPIGPPSFLDAYTIGVCQYSGTNANVTVTITELNGQSRTLTKKLTNEKDGWLVGTTAGGSVIPARGWCGDHDPTTIGEASVQPLGSLKSKKAKRRKMLKILLAEVPNKALVGYKWKGKGGSKGFATAGKNVLRLKTPAKAGKYKLQLTYLGKRILSTTITVK